MKLLRRFRALFCREKLDAEMAEEMRAHLELQTRENARRGMAPDEARYAAQREFGGVEQIKECARDQRGWHWLEHLAQDLRYALRTLRKTPGFTTVVVLSLALGIGANAFFFGLLDRTFLQALPVKNPGELVRFQWQMEPDNGGMKDGFYEAPWHKAVSGKPAGTIFSSATFEQFRADRTLLSEVFAFSPTDRLVLKFDGRTETAYGQIVSGNYHLGLGIAAAQGRTLLPDDDRPDATPVAVISRRYWQRCFGDDPAVLGKTIWINRAPVTVVGILPDNCGDPLEGGGYLARDVTLPLAMLHQIDPSLGPKKSLPSSWWLRIMARVRPGVTPEQVAASLNGGFQATARDGLKKSDDPLALRVVPGERGLLENRRTNAEFLFLPVGLAVLVLLVACANVATLLLARGSARRREIAVRLALGASRSRIVRQLITESVLLALLGSAGGLLLAAWSGAVWDIGGAWRLDGRLLGFTTLVAFFTAIAFGVVPALRATRLDLTAEFQGGARTLGRDARSWLSRSLVAGQVALSCVLLVLAGLLVRTLHNLRTADVSFNRANLLLVSIETTFAGYRKPQARELFGRIAERVEGLPGIRSVTFSSFGQLDGGTPMRGFLRRTEVPAGLSNLVRVQEVAPNFFATYEIPLVAGRGFTPHDAESSQRVIVINERAAKVYFGSGNPLGRTTLMGGAEIIGVVRDAKYGNVRSDAEAVYLPFAQSPTEFATFAIRTPDDPLAVAASVRKLIAEIDGNLLVTAVRTQDDQIESLLGRERLYARLATSIGLLALVLACVGLYGLMSYAVVRRTGEIGVRMALGALPSHVLWSVLRESLALAAIGAIAGLAGAAAAVRLVASSLYGLSSTDAETYAVVALLLIAVAGLAALLPAWRASKVDPMVALRAE